MLYEPRRLKLFKTMSSRKSLLLDVVLAMSSLCSKGINLMDNCKKVVGNGDSTLFLE